MCLEIYFTFGEKYEALGKDSAMGDAMAMRSLLENNLGMIIAFDGQGTVTFLNGIAREELDYRQGKKKISVEDIFPTLIRGNCNYDEYVNSVQGQLIKTVAYRKNNTCFPVMIRFSKLFFEDVGQINAVAGLNIQDEEDAIRELKKVEQEMEQNLKARDSFVANITHELRTPVNGIKGHVKICWIWKQSHLRNPHWVSLSNAVTIWRKLLIIFWIFQKWRQANLKSVKNRLNSKAVSIRRWIPTGQWQIRKGCIFMRL